ncbi:MAG: leucine--tRNA ligase [Bacilli bacterium]
MYNFSLIEKKWQSIWEKENTFYTNTLDFSKPKYYCLDMFPYPSGEGLHVGHPEGYTATDIVCRMKRMQGFNVLHPIGFDSFGLPAEQYAIKTGNHPEEFTKKNIENFTRQLKMLGFSFDWSKTISTCDPSFYKWTQWIFTLLYKEGLAKEIEMPVNWCEELGSVLANDEVINGLSERGGYPVIKKNMKQWVIDIPVYAQKLLSGLDDLDWPLSTKEIQRNWIGKSVGANVTFKVKDSDKSFIVFTTRPDTLFGCTYCVLSIEHELISSLTTKDKIDEVEAYIKEVSKKSELERTDITHEKTGVFTGSYAINPVNNKEIPIYISDYVLNTYGTGAIMSVPAHDERDYAFATKFKLDIIPVIDFKNNTLPYTGDGIHINSEFLNNLNKEEAINKILEYLTTNNIGEKKVNYKMREWIFARQRYWGEPIPIVHYNNGETSVLSDTDLPLTLPVLKDYKPLSNGSSPLEKATEWLKYEKNNKIGTRETSTMPGSAGSSWYYLRYIDPNNDKVFADKELLSHWMPVDLYMGGPEHAVGHLLYSRMWNHFLYDLGYTTTKEPFKRLVHQGMILGTNGEKMSKSRGNVINPDDIISNYGTDTLRLYLMFMGPLESSKPWDESGVKGSKKFLDKIYRLYTEDNIIKDEECISLEKIYNQTVKKVTNDYESLNINTSISTLMIFINEVIDKGIFPLSYALNFLKLLNPICPHITEELYSILSNNKETISYSSWPTYEEEKTIETSVNIALSVNGKLRSTITVEKDTTKEELLNIAYKDINIQKYTKEKTIIKEIVVINKIVNIVVGEK